jgi:hypothetical protein
LVAQSKRRPWSAIVADLVRSQRRFGPDPRRHGVALRWRWCALAGYYKRRPRADRNNDDGSRLGPSSAQAWLAGRDRLHLRRADRNGPPRTWFSSPSMLMVAGVLTPKARRSPTRTSP